MWLYLVLIWFLINLVLVLLLFDMKFINWVFVLIFKVLCFRNMVMIFLILGMFFKVRILCRLLKVLSFWVVLFYIGVNVYFMICYVIGMFDRIFILISVFLWNLVGNFVVFRFVSCLFRCFSFCWIWLVFFVVFWLIWLFFWLLVLLFLLVWLLVEKRGFFEWDDMVEKW